MKNRYEIVGDGTVKIYVNRYGVQRPLILIDESDLPRVEAFPNTWRVRWDMKARTAYAYGQMMVDGKLKTIYLHRWILQANPGEVVDHIGHNGLDNRRTMLRVVTCSGNASNRRSKSQPLGDLDGITGWSYWPQDIEADAYSPVGEQVDQSVNQGMFSMGVPHVHGVPLGRFADYSDEWLVVWIGVRVMGGETDKQILQNMCSLGHNELTAKSWIEFVRTRLNKVNPA